MKIVSVLNLYKSQTGDISWNDLQDRINNPDTPADLREALQGLSQDWTLFSAIGSQGDGKCGGRISSKDLMKFSNSHSQILTWNGGSLNNAQLEIVAILDRHKDKCPISWDSIRDQANDTSNPPDLRAALQKLANDPALFYAIGSQDDGKCGGKITDKDLGKFSNNHSQVKEFNEKQAQNYMENYIPSDASQNQSASVMTENDALRELYRYSDYLPKKLNEDTFKRIVDGTENVGKCPPQVIAAAQYFLQHRQAWSQLNQTSDDNPTMSKSDFLHTASSSIHLNKDEIKTASTINKNLDAFFGDGDLTRDKLASIATNKSLSNEVRDTAKQLLQDPLLFGLINNARSGYKTKKGFFDFGGPTVDSGVIGKKDFQQFFNNMSPANKSPESRVTHKTKSAESQSAVADMGMGIDDQPDIKAVKKSGGFLMHAMDKILNIAGKVFDIGSQIVGALGFIPGFGEIADALSLVAEAESKACKILSTIIEGGNIGKAFAEAGIDMASAALGCIGGPEMRMAMREGLARKLMEKTMNTGIDMAIDQAKSFTDSYLQNLKGRLDTPSTNYLATAIPA
ncbi:HrpF/NolX family T3SS translocon protein [Uliginosibacterium gangwonense]|uniref:HrpF/NolX family T3SS translocon protein n=1 Tax=Uliginosibacterium gangwonense TaxID=392736 RepID=UPI001B7F889D|nr:HrpF/NolX family T3SS translocon protein [Uliginosibacterium gangwonense]